MRVIALLIGLSLCVVMMLVFGATAYLLGNDEVVDLIVDYGKAEMAEVSIKEAVAKLTKEETVVQAVEPEVRPTPKPAPKPKPVEIHDISQLEVTGGTMSMQSYDCHKTGMCFPEFEQQRCQPGSVWEHKVFKRVWKRGGDSRYAHTYQLLYCNFVGNSYAFPEDFTQCQKVGGVCIKTCQVFEEVGKKPLYLGKEVKAVVNMNIGQAAFEVACNEGPASLRGATPVLPSWYRAPNVSRGTVNPAYTYAELE